MEWKIWIWSNNNNKWEVLRIRPILRGPHQVKSKNRREKIVISDKNAQKKKKKFQV